MPNRLVCSGYMVALSVLGCMACVHVVSVSLSLSGSSSKHIFPRLELVLPWGDSVCEEISEAYNVRVPVAATREVQVQVCRMVPKLVPITIYPCSNAGSGSNSVGVGCAACGGVPTPAPVVGCGNCGHCANCCR